MWALARPILTLAGIIIFVLMTLLWACPRRALQRLQSELPASPVRDVGIVQIKNAKPGLLTEGLRTALGMADGSPPPWLINMQRYGPPPSYGDLKVRFLFIPGHSYNCLVHGSLPSLRASCCRSMF